MDATERDGNGRVERDGDGRDERDGEPATDETGRDEMRGITFEENRLWERERRFSQINFDLKLKP